MAYYLDITLLANAEVNASFLLSKLYQQLHLLLVQHKTATGNSKVGFAFPEYKLLQRDDKGKIKEPSTLGSKLRLFALEQQSIEQLKLSEHLQKYGLLDYLHLTAIRACPKIDKLQKFTRYRYKNARSTATLARLARRYAKRHAITPEQAIANYANLEDKNVDFPYVQLTSSSNDNRRYPMHIKCTECEVDNIEPIFNTFGLAVKGGIPIIE